MMHRPEQTDLSRPSSPQAIISENDDNLEQMAEKIRKLQAMLNDKSKMTISDDEVAKKMFPTTDPDEVPGQSGDEIETDSPSVNSSSHTPFLSKVGDHKTKENGLILFRCHDTDDENESWCDADKAVTNVGKKEFRWYVNDNNLNKTAYTPVAVKPVKPVGKKDMKRMANMSKVRADVSKFMSKIIERRQTNDGEKYKVLTDDLRATWKTIDDIGPDFCRLINEFNAKKSNDVPKPTSKKTKEKVKNKSPVTKKGPTKKSGGTASTTRKQTSKKKEYAKCS